MTTYQKMIGRCSDTRFYWMRLLSHTLLLLVLFSPDVSYNVLIAPAIAAAGIAAGASLLGTGGQAYAQGKMNKKTREWNEKMYAKQRTDALADWQMQNVYNSPEQQMQRLKDAGLNPNLVYGNGAEAMSNQAPRQSDTGNWNPQTPDYAGAMQNAANTVLGYYDMKLKTAQHDNIKAQNDQIQEQIRSQKMDNIAKSMTYLSDANTKLVSNDAFTRYAVQKAKQELYNLTAQGDVLDATASNTREDSVLKGHQGVYTQRLVDSEKIRQKTMIDENDRAWIMNSTNVKEAKARIVSMAYANAQSEAQKKLILKNAAGQEFENQMKSFDLNYYKKSGSRQGTSPFTGVYQQGNYIMNKLLETLNKR